MRYLPMILGAGILLSIGLLAGSGPAHAAMPTLALDRSAVADTAVEKVAYYHRYARRHYRRNYYGYGYNYNYGYHRPYYGYGYRRPYRLWLWLWASLALLRRATAALLAPRSRRSAARVLMDEG